MPITILPQEGSFMQTLGAGLGRGVQAGTGEYLKYLDRQRTAQGLQALGFPEAQAGELASVDPAIIQEVLKGLGARGMIGTPGLGALTPQQLIAEGQPAETMRDTPQEQTAENLSLLSALELPTLAEQRAQRKETLEERKFAQKQKEFAYRETAPFRKELAQNEKGARDTLDILNRMEELEKTGKLNTPGAEEFLLRSGLDVPALRNPESQEFLKLQASFLRDAKKYFGARVTNFELEQFLKGIPTLTQTPQGRGRIIAGLKKLNEGNRMYAKEARKIIKQNEGIPPLDLQEQVNKRVGKRLDKLADQFKKEVKKLEDLPEPSRIGTVAGILGGEIAGRAPHAVTGAGLGFLAGGPVGAALGGAGGALAGPGVMGLLKHLGI